MISVLSLGPIIQIYARKLGHMMCSSCLSATNLDDCTHGVSQGSKKHKLVNLEDLCELTFYFSLSTRKWDCKILHYTWPKFWNTVGIAHLWWCGPFVCWWWWGIKLVVSGKLASEGPYATSLLHLIALLRNTLTISDTSVDSSEASLALPVLQWLRQHLQAQQSRQHTVNVGRWDLDF